MSFAYNTLTRQQITSKTYKHTQPVVRQVQLTGKEKAAENIWFILKNAMRLQFFKSMERIREFDFNVNRKKFINENFERGYRIEDREAGKMRPRARTLDPFAEYSRARLLKDISQKLRFKNNTNITVSSVDTVNLQQRLYQMQKILQESMIQKQQNSRANDTESNNSILFELMTEVIRLKKELAKRQGSQGSNRYPQSISNISRQSQTNNSEHFQKPNQMKYGSSQASEQIIIKNADSKYETCLPQNKKIYQPIPRQTFLYKPPNEHQTTMRIPSGPPPRPPIQKPTYRVEHPEVQNRQYPTTRQYISPPTQKYQQRQTVHYPPASQKNSIQYQYPKKLGPHENPIHLIETKYKSPETKNYYPQQKFSQTNPFNKLSEGISPQKPLEETKLILKQKEPQPQVDRKGKKLTVISQYPSRTPEKGTQNQVSRKSSSKEIKPVILSGVRKSNDFCDECGRCCKCEQIRRY